ncbi:MAG: hypothetical protein JWO10_2161 [Microbacteriaceae bacterium]|nr:hypothetical protein [Microbacteriaceae bacterium]
MKRTIAAVLTGALAIGLAVTGVTTAFADSNSPTPYTVDAAGVTLPSPDTFPANGDVNVTYTQAGVSAQKSIHFDPNNNQPGGAWIGKSNIPWSGFGLAGNYCITWVQVSLYNAHFGEGGQAPFCVTTTAQDADASLSVTKATCTSAETVSLGTLTNAKWTSQLGTTGPGTYTVVATADSSHLFSDGKNTKTFTDTLAGKSTTGCASDPTCISDPTFSYSYNGEEAGTVTATKPGVRSGTLCAPLYIRATTWTFDSPVNGNSPSWPQTLVGYNDVELSSLGTVSYTAPVVELCKQNDIYASFDGFGALYVPEKLTAPGQPSEPQFLHAALPGDGPNPTYFTSASTGCDHVQPVATVISGLCYWDAGQKASFKTVRFEFDNTLSNVPVFFEVESNQYIDNSAYNRTVAAHSIVYVSAQASWTGGVGYTVHAGADSFDLSVGSYDPCPPTVATCTTTSTALTSTNLKPQGWTFDETRTLGTNTYTAGTPTGGLTIETHNNTNTDPEAGAVGNGTPDQRKAAGYHATDVLLSAIGTPSIAYDQTSGSLPGINLTIDKDGDGGKDGNLVYEPTLFGADNWWSTQDLGVVSTKVIPNPSYQKSFGTLNDFLASWPNAKVIAVGYSLGSGAVGEGVIHSITAGCVTYPFDYETITAGVPAEVTFADSCGVNGDQVNVPSLNGITSYTYKTVDGRNSAGVGTVTVTAEPAKGYSFGSDVVTSWSHAFLSDADNKCVTITGDPRSTDQVCDFTTLDGVVQGTITVDAVTGAKYVIHKTTLPATPDVTVLAGATKVEPGDYLVTAVAEDGYTLTTPYSWPYTVADRATNCQETTLPAFDPEVTPSNPVCTDGSQVSGYLSIDPSDPLAYFIGSQQLTGGRNAMPAGTYSVLAVAPAGDGVSGTNPTIVTISSLSALGIACGSLTTLAFTGVGGLALYLFIAAALLLAGAAVMIMRKPRHQPRHLS